MCSSSSPAAAERDISQNMKNQYFGDVNDYRKYGLLRHLGRSGFARLVVAWMLTPDDGGPDGSFRAYLDDATQFSSLDPQLHRSLASLLKNGVQPAVRLLEGSGVLPSASFYSVMVPDRWDERIAWRCGLLDAARNADLVFVDPDNGIEVKSKPVGRKGSSKYVAWDELIGLWDAACSTLTYQHFRREERTAFARRLADEFMERTGAAHVEAFRTPHVLFLLAAQERHTQLFRRACSETGPTWSGHIHPMGLANRPLKPPSGVRTPS
jgi:hypothetical protein